MLTKTRVWWFWLVLAGVAGGCGPDAPPRFPVQGRVTFGGQPVENGVVRFVPIGQESGPARHSPEIVIHAGEYRMDTVGGLQQGPYRVEVEVREKTGKKTMINIGTEQIESDAEAVVSPPQYAGAASPLTYTAEPGAAERFDIDVPAK